jgi:iron-sulfur cluster repair protein YtfE (RIC family)
MLAATPSQIRAALLGEHFELRRLVEETRRVLATGDGDGHEPVRGCIDRLAEALRSHSEHEEQAVRAILKPAYARPAGRTAVMDEAHIAEHARFVFVLRELFEAPVVRRDRVALVLTELESHMADEEDVLLAEELLAGE